MWVKTCRQAQNRAHAWSLIGIETGHITCLESCLCRSPSLDRPPVNGDVGQDLQVGIGHITVWHMHLMQVSCVWDRTHHKHTCYAGLRA
jgi:hypothetical protein